MITPDTHILIKNPTELEGKLKAIKRDGLEKLHLIFDYDRTVTGKSPEGKPVVTTWAVFEELLSAEYQTKRKELYAKYHQIEIDLTQILAIRAEKMREWWATHLRLLCSENLNRELLKGALKSNPLHLREKAGDIMRFCSSKEIPVLIMSAGIGDIISMHLESLGLLTNNLHIVSNFLRFDTEGKVTGFERDIVHSCNKDQTHVVNTDWSEQVSEHPNIILVGDNTGDATMDKGLKSKNVIRIGYLNDQGQNLEAFQNAFDVVITGDADMSFIYEILQSIK